MGQDVTFDIIARDRASSTFSKVGAQAAKGSGGLSKFSSGMKALGGLALGGGLVSFFKSANEEAREAQKVGAQTEAVIKSTGKAANLSAEQFGKLAEKISLKTGIDDEQIQAGQNMLATFTNIRDGLGKNNKIFTEATKISTDLAVATKTDQVAANVLLGKALNDPAKGLGRLTKIGVTFTEQQKKQVAQMTKTGNTAGAQRVILKELAKEFGGSAEAQATAGDKAAVAVGNLKEQIGTALLPVVDKFARFVSKKVVPAVSKFVTEFQNGTGTAGDIRDALEDVANVGKRVFAFFKSIPAPVALFAGKAALAALALSKVSKVMAAVKASAFVTAMTTSAAASTAAGTAAQGTVSRMGRLGAAAKGAAGIGGMLLLANSTKQTSKVMGGLQGAVGGAATGFAVGGPLGAGLGFVAGGLIGVFSSGKKAASSIQKAGEAANRTAGYVDTFREAMNKLGGFNKKKLRVDAVAAIRKELGGSLSVLEDFGIGVKDIADAATGNAVAQRKVQDATQAVLDEYRKAKKEGRALTAEDEKRHNAALRINRALREQKVALVETKRAFVEEGIAAGKWASVLEKGVPETLVTKVRLDGIPQAVYNVTQMAKKYKLTPPEIKSMLRLAGVKDVQARYDDVMRLLRTLNNTTATPKLNPKNIKTGIALLDEFIRKLTTANNGGGGDDPILEGYGSGSRGSGGPLAAIAAQIAKGTPKVKVALERARNLLQRFRDQVSSLMSTRKEFTSTFSSDSIFGADMETTGTLDKLMQFQSLQAQNAQQVLNDVRNLTSRGLSKDLIAQLQSAGSSGAAQLRLLAGASQAQIQQFNELNKQTVGANAQAGLVAGNYIRGGDIDNDIRQAQQNAATTKAIIDALNKMKLETKVKGGDIIIAVRAENQTRGRAPGDFSR